MTDFEREANTEWANDLAMTIGLSGVSDEEVKWTAHRITQLISSEGKPKDEALAIVKREAVERPWLSASGL